MKKLIILIALAFPFFFSSCSQEGPEVNKDLRTRTDESLPWFGTEDQAWDSFWEIVEERDLDAEYLTKQNWLPEKIKSQFIVALEEGGATMNDSEYPWEDHSFVVREILEWGGDEGNKPIKIRYTLWALQINESYGREYFRYFIPESPLSYYTVTIDPYE